MKVDKLSYEEALKELKSGLKKLEEDEITLEESMETFKTSVELYKHCNKLIKDVEGEIEVILKDEEKEVVEFNLEDQDGFL